MGSTPKADVKKPAGLGRVFLALAETEGFANHATKRMKSGFFECELAAYPQKYPAVSKKTPAQGRAGCDLNTCASLPTDGCCQANHEAQHGHASAPRHQGQ